MRAANQDKSIDPNDESSRDSGAPRLVTRQYCISNPRRFRVVHADHAEPCNHSLHFYSAIAPTRTLLGTSMCMVAFAKPRVSHGVPLMLHLHNDTWRQEAFFLLTSCPSRSMVAIATPDLGRAAVRVSSSSTVKRYTVSVACAHFDRGGIVEVIFARQDTQRW